MVERFVHVFEKSAMPRDDGGLPEYTPASSFREASEPAGVEYCLFTGTASRTAVGMKSERLQQLASLEYRKIESRNGRNRTECGTGLVLALQVLVCAANRSSPCSTAEAVAASRSNGEMLATLAGVTECP